MRRHLHIQLLCYTGQPELDVMEFIQGEVFNLANNGDFGVSYSSIRGNSMLPHARNTTVSDFLSRSECTDLIMIDCDNYPEKGALLKMMGRDVDVLGYPCRAKTEAFTWPVVWFDDRPIERAPNGLIEVKGVGTGIIRFTRACLEQVVASLGRDGWYFDKWAVTGKAWPIFTYPLKDFDWYGEDTGFCDKWRALGGKVWIDPDVETHHIGRFDYSGRVADWLAKMPKNISISKRDARVANAFSGDAA